MNSINFVVLWHFVIGIAVTAAGDWIGAHPSDEVTLRIIYEEDTELNVTLRKTDSMLANENLPVWTVQGSSPEELISDIQVMRTVGRFSMYQNSEQSSAAVYFHELQKFYGTIDVRFIIDAVLIGDIENQYRENRQSLWIPGVLMRNYPEHKYRESRSTKVQHQLVSVFPLETIGGEIPNGSQSPIRFRRERADVVYVKLLVFVNYDLADRLRSESNERMGIVHYILTLFNSVDMLYSKVNEPNIKINIAGIIIGNDRDSFPSLADCFRETEFNGFIIVQNMEARCTNSAIQSFVQKHSKTLSPDSYNFPIFLTSYSVRFQLHSTNKFVAGTTTSPPFGPYQLRKQGLTIVPAITVKDEKYFGSFCTIAHEIAHALGFRAHDEGPYVNQDKNCVAHLMKPWDDVCENCLSWSSATKEHFKDFFNSRDRCFFLKKPPSLQETGLHEVWTEDEQCRCYGYDSARTSKRVYLAFREITILHRICRIPIKDNCAVNLRCNDRYHRSHKVPRPLDGTPCGEDAESICWNRECKPVQIHQNVRREMVGLDH